MITIAGSGPSTALVDHVTVATKKRSVSSDYVALRFMHNNQRYRSSGTPLMVYYRRGDNGYLGQIWRPRTDWNAYYRRFVRSQRPPQRSKPSSGLCAVLMSYERWKPEKVGLIGFDWVLDGNPDWDHDAIAERACIESLVEVVDLRHNHVTG